MSKLIAAAGAVLLLLLAKEVETDTGPLHGMSASVTVVVEILYLYIFICTEPDNLTVDKWSHSRACLMCHATVHAKLTNGTTLSKDTHPRVHCGNNYCSQPLDNTMVIQHFMCYTHRWRTKCAAVMFKLLMLSGDVETNPGPTGM